MNQIKFSHEYKKLNKEQTARLVCVQQIWIEQQATTFLVYDTEGVFKLPEKGPYILLLFKGKNGTILTTLRSFYQDKYEYYLKSIGEVFELVRI